MRKALIVGIDHYDHLSPLGSCVDDAHSVKAVLERNADGSLNFATPRLMTGTSSGDRVDRRALKEAVRDLFSDDAEIALFYFAGHGYIEDVGGYLCGTDCVSGDDGLPMSELLILATKSPAKSNVIILDSCHSGVAASRSGDRAIAEVKQGMTILAASTDQQAAIETAGGGGVFTNLLVDALNGAAANLLGQVTAGSVYAHIDQSLGPFRQRPVFKTNVKSFVSLRQAAPPIASSDLRALAMHFPTPGYRFQLDPSYEPRRSTDEFADPRIPTPDPTKNAVFAILQNYAKVNLVRPVDAPHMWDAAMQWKSCQLTALGEHYRRLVADSLI